MVNIVEKHFSRNYQLSKERKINMSRRMSKLKSTNHDKISSKYGTVTVFK